MPTTAEHTQTCKVNPSKRHVDDWPNVREEHVDRNERDAIERHVDKHDAGVDRVHVEVDKRKVGVELEQQRPVDEVEKDRRDAHRLPREPGRDDERVRHAQQRRLAVALGRAQPRLAQPRKDGQTQHDDKERQVRQRGEEAVRPQAGAALGKVGPLHAEHDKLVNQQQ